MQIYPFIKSIAKVFSYRTVLSFLNLDSSHFLSVDNFEIYNNLLAIAEFLKSFVNIEALINIMMYQILFLQILAVVFVRRAAFLFCNLDIGLYLHQPIQS